MENKSNGGLIAKVIALAVLVLIAGAFMMKAPATTPQPTPTDTSSQQIDSNDDVAKLEQDASVATGVDNLDASLDATDQALGL